MPAKKSIRWKVYEEKTTTKIGELKRTVTLEPMISKPGGKAKMIIEQDPISMDRALFGKTLHIGDEVLLHVGKVTLQSKLGGK